VNILKYLLGKTTAPSTIISAEIGKAEKECAIVRARVTAALAGLATMTDAEHVAAESKQAELTRNEARLEARIAELRAELATAQTAELDAARIADENQFNARIAAARESLANDAPQFLQEYDGLAEKIVAVLVKLGSIDAEITAVNAARRHTPGAEPIRSVNETYRKQPDQNRPDVTDTRMCWVVTDPMTGEEQVQIADQAPFQFYDGVTGRMENPRGRLERREVVVSPGRSRRGAYLPELSSVVLPPGTLVSPWHWPKG
jgi:hypothetical protein